MDIFSELFGMFDELDGVFTPVMHVKESKKCPRCGSRWEDIKRSGKFGCDECYKTFYEGAKATLKQTHSATEHTGKIPSKSGAEVKAKRRLAELKTQLKDAVDSENYELAAKLHNEIKELEGGAGK